MSRKTKTWTKKWQNTKVKKCCFPICLRTLYLFEHIETCVCLLNFGDSREHRFTFPGDSNGLDRPCKRRGQQWIVDRPCKLLVDELACNHRSNARLGVIGFETHRRTVAIILVREQGYQGCVIKSASCMWLAVLMIDWVLCWQGLGEGGVGAAHLCLTIHCHSLQVCFCKFTS